MIDIKVIIFDLGGVIFDNGTRKTKKFLKEKYLIKDNVLKNIFYGEEASLFRNGKINSSKFWKFVNFVFEKEKAEIDKDDLKSIWYNSFMPQKGIFKLLQNLHNNYELGIISGNIKERVKFLDGKYHFRKYFDWEIYSFDVGINKPNLKIYKEALQKINVKERNCLYIDDQETFLKPARILGMNTLLFKTYEEFLKDLSRLQINL